MRYYVVVDTNVLVSALLRGASVPGVILREALEGRIIPLLNGEIVEEYRDVLHRRKFRFNSEAVEVLMDGLVKRGIFVDAGPVDELLPDPDDAVFYEVVMEARKEQDAFLVTGNLRHFPAKHFVVTPREMLDILEQEDR